MKNFEFTPMFIQKKALTRILVKALTLWCRGTESILLRHYVFCKLLVILALEKP